MTDYSQLLHNLRQRAADPKIWGDDVKKEWTLDWSAADAIEKLQQATRPSPHIEGYEQAMRVMLDLFAKDPPDSEYQEGFLAALVMVAVEVLGFKWNDPSVLAAERSPHMAQHEATTMAKVRPKLTVIHGGNSAPVRLTDR